MGDIIDIRSRIKTKTTAESIVEAAESAIVDLGAMRTEIMQEDRRTVKRTILTEFIAVHAVVPGMGLMKVALYDINDNGVAFDIEEGRGQFVAGEEVALRVYLNHQTYFPFVVRVKHVKHVEAEGVTRHGAEFEKGAINDGALYHFVKFIENVSANLKRDQGDVFVSNINS